MTKYQRFLAAVFAIIWIWSAANPVKFDGWLLENLLVFVFVPIILYTGRYFRLSSVSYTLIVAFLILHLIGAHYTYGEVPFGYTLQEWFGATRTMYDRLVHFCFGLLIAYPIREVFIRVTGAKGVWGYYFPFDIVLSFSAVFEIIEWIVVILTSEAAGVAYLGMQGDIWDAQKDMLCAATGAFITMLVVYFINLKFNKRFAEEIRESLRIKRKKPLGEDGLQEMLREDVRPPKSSTA